METKGKGKAIIGIAMAAIMLASVFAAMVPISARDSAGEIQAGDIIYQGEQGLDVSAVGNVYDTKIFYGIKDSTADGEQLIVGTPTSWNVPSSAVEGPYNSNTRENTTADIIIDKPEITVNVYIEGSTDSVVDKSIPTGTKLEIHVEPNFGGILNDSSATGWGKVKVKIDEPGGGEYEYSETFVADTQEVIINTTGLGDTDEWEGTPTLDTTDWDTGTWKIKVTTDKGTCNLLDISSPEYEFTIRSEELSIEATEGEVGKGEDMILTVNGNPNTRYYLIVTDVDTTEPPSIKSTTDIDTLDTAGAAYPTTTIWTPNLAAWIKTGADGVADIRIDTTDADERTYTIKVYDATTPAYPDFDPDASVVSVDDDDVDVEVMEPEVTFDLPASAVIGEEVEIKGTVSAGDKVDVVIEDANKVFDNEKVDADNEFEVKWKTGGLTTGSYTIDVYIDEDTATTLADYDKIDEDGKTSIRLVSGELTATQPRKVIAEDDDYTIEGTATGVDRVDIILIGPDGYPPDETSLDVEVGLEIISSSVDSDDEYDEDTKMGGAGFDTGSWIALVLSPGRDDEYATGDGAGGLGLDSFSVALDGKDQGQILAIIEDGTIDRAGSDDLLVPLAFKVESAYVDLNPVETVGVGEPLNISGTTNREPKTMITIDTFLGPIDLPVGIAEVEWPTADEGVFTATIDTTDAVEGTYTLEADDGDGNVDTITVTIGEAAPEPTATAEPTAEPTATAVPTAEATAEPTATPTEEPGFEAVFAIAGLLSIAYLVLRRRK